LGYFIDIILPAAPWPWGLTRFLTEMSREGAVKTAVAWVRQPYDLHVPSV
jgi:hypothetical protein